MPARASRRRGRASDTRQSILREAEELFAERGFEGTRLEDVAERVGVQRPALFYHFRDKRALYDAVVEDVFGTLLDRARAAFRGGRSLAESLEAAVTLWVDYVWERPTTAHILLREACNRVDPSDAFQRLCRPTLDLLMGIFAEGERSGVFRPLTDEPLRFASMVCGSTVFFVAALPRLAPELPFDPSSREQRDAHREDVLRVTRRLLGLGPRAVPGPA